eukprot:scaffold116292_cov29-Tisochrysis_lutea.AAC.1
MSLASVFIPRRVEWLGTRREGRPPPSPRRATSTKHPARTQTNGALSPFSRSNGSTQTTRLGFCGRGDTAQREGGRNKG